jgi:hypothetical protein
MLITALSSADVLAVLVPVEILQIANEAEEKTEKCTYRRSKNCKMRT